MKIRYPLIALTLLAGMGSDSAAAVKTPRAPRRAEAIFAGGCFWCMEKPFDEIPGVVSTVSGYTAGHKKDPTYREVSSGKTGHTEAVKVVYDPDKVAYEGLLEVFWKNIDPLAKDRQFCDRGTQYRSGIYYRTKREREAAKRSLKTKTAELKERFSKEKITIHTEIEKASRFYPAEEHHQDYYQVNPIRYKYYRYGCGRDKRLEELWGRPKRKKKRV